MPHRSPGFRLVAAAAIGVAVAVLAAGAGAPFAQPAPDPPATNPASEAGAERAATATPSTVRLHVGVPERVFIGQSRDLLLKAFPGAESFPFAGQKDAVTVRARDAGISCVLTGSTEEELRVASIGFNLEGTYEGVGEGAWRTEAGIGRGSTVNDLLGSYGRPAGIVDQGARRRAASRPTPDTPKLYQYRSDDGTISTSFVVQFNRVVRIVVNHIEPLERHLFRRSPTEPAPDPGGSAPAPEPPPSPTSPSPPAPPRPPPDPGVSPS